MTQLEILKLAASMVCVKYNKEEEIAKFVQDRYGHEDLIASARMEKLQKQFEELNKLICAEEQSKSGS